jgi:exosortase
MAMIDDGASLADRGASRAFLTTALVVSAVGLGWAYSSSLAMLVDRWSRDDNYSHGFLVLPVAAAILWRRRARLDGLALAPSWWGVAGLAALLAARSWLFERDDQWLEAATIPMAAASVALALGGRGLLGWAWPAIAFSWFMLPLPTQLNTAMAGPLQSLATLGSVTLLRATGLPVISQGNVIIVGGERLEVARACNGLSMLLSFATLVAAMVALVDRPARERVALVLGVVPVALLCNVLRIVATAWATHLAGHAVDAAHDWAGLAMMPAALALMWLEVRILSWVVVEVDPAGPTRPAPLAGD